MAKAKVPAAVRKWFSEQGRKAGQARMKKISPRKRSALAKAAANARWGNGRRRRIKAASARAHARVSRLRMAAKRKLPWGHQSRKCVYCGLVGPRTQVAGGFAHKRCIPT